MECQCPKGLSILNLSCPITFLFDRPLHLTLFEVVSGLTSGPSVTPLCGTQDLGRRALVLLAWVPPIKVRNFVAGFLC